MDDLLKAGIFKAPFFRPEFLERADKYLAVFVALLLICLLADAVTFRPSAAAKKAVSGPSDGKAGARHPAGAPRHDETDYAYYRSVLSEKQVFGGGAAPGDEAPEGPAEIGLVGILMGARPQAIIEDRKTQAVYYAYKGDRFEDFVVEEVSADRAVVSCDGRKIELEL